MFPIKSLNIEIMIKKLYPLLFVCFAIAILPGCSQDNVAATDGATADDFAKYEADLAAATADGFDEEE